MRSPSQIPALLSRVLESLWVPAIILALLGVAVPHYQSCHTMDFCLLCFGWRQGQDRDFLQTEKHRVARSDLVHSALAVQEFEAKRGAPLTQEEIGMFYRSGWSRIPKMVTFTPWGYRYRMDQHCRILISLGSDAQAGGILRARDIGITLGAGPRSGEPHPNCRRGVTLLRSDSWLAHRPLSSSE